MAILTSKPLCILHSHHETHLNGFASNAHATLQIYKNPWKTSDSDFEPNGDALETPPVPSSKGQHWGATLSIKPQDHPLTTGHSHVYFTRVFRMSEISQWETNSLSDQIFPRGCLHFFISDLRSYLASRRLDIKDNIVKMLIQISGIWHAINNRHGDLFKFGLFVRPHLRGRGPAEHLKAVTVF